MNPFRSPHDNYSLGVGHPPKVETLADRHMVEVTVEVVVTPETVTEAIVR